MAKAPQAIIDKACSVFRSFGLPEPRVKGSGVDLSLIPIGGIDLAKLHERFPDLKVSIFKSLTCVGVDRNTDYEIVYEANGEASEDDDVYEEKTKIHRAVRMIVSNTTEDLIASNIPTFERLEDRIPTKLRKNIQSSGSLADIRNWKVKVVLRNSAGQDAPEIGEYDDVGYTMVNIDSGEIVPIARSDEHHMGFDLMGVYKAKKMISGGRWFPIFFGNNYVYDEYPEEIKKALKAFQIWLDNGGANTTVSSGGNRRIDYVITMKDFIAANGEINLPKGDLLPMGRRLVSRLEKCAMMLKDLHLGKPVKESKIVDYAELVLKEFGDCYSFITEQKAVAAAIAEFRAGGSLKAVEEALFSHDGLKNKIHMDIREGLAKKDRFYGRASKELFGDLEFAMREFNRLGMI